MALQKEKSTQPLGTRYKEEHWSSLFEQPFTGVPHPKGICLTDGIYRDERTDCMHLSMLGWFRATLSPITKLCIALHSFRKVGSLFSGKLALNSFFSGKLALPERKAQLFFSGKLALPIDALQTECLVVCYR